MPVNHAAGGFDERREFECVEYLAGKLVEQGTRTGRQQEDLIGTANHENPGISL
jgi:hypothetical protein